jgi:thiol:disulfide interchange protein
MRQIAGVIWVIFAIVSAGASMLLALDMFRLRTRMGKYWGLMLAGDAAFAFCMTLALAMSRRGASTISVVIGLLLLLIAQGFKTATAGACALHMRANLNGKRKPETEEAKDDPE